MPAQLADGSQEVEVTAGDLLLFPHDHRLILGTDLTLSPAPVGSEPLEGLVEVRSGGDGEATRYLRLPRLRQARLSRTARAAACDVAHPAGTADSSHRSRASA